MATKNLSGLDSWVLIEIPKSDLELQTYRDWLNSEILRAWLFETEGNPRYADESRNYGEWNDEGYVFGNFGGVEYGCKLYRLDGDNPYKKRGILLRDHNDGPEQVERVHVIADSLEEFLRSMSIAYIRENREAIRSSRT